MEKTISFNEFCKILQIEHKLYGESNYFKQGIEKIIQTKDLSRIFETAEKFPDQKSLETAIIESGNPGYNYFFAYSIKGADIKAHEDVVLKSGDPEYNYLFAYGIKGVDIKAHEDVVLKSGNPEYNYHFVLNVKGADIEKHRKVVIQSGDPQYNCLFAEYLPGTIEDKIKHAKVVYHSDENVFKGLFRLRMPEIWEKATMPTLKDALSMEIEY